MSKESDLPVITPKSTGSSIRFVTFNINGFRTLFQYHPWTTHRNLAAMFRYLQADIITLQELKLQKSDINDKVARVDGYQAFITAPGLKCKRKGYAGVSVHVRVPQDHESDAVKRSLKVVKAEEGITGVLKSPDTGFAYRDSPSESVIGGYVTFNDLEGEEFTDAVLQDIDSEGRVVLIELANNTVVISTYCPANSMDTDEGELFRVRFISILFQRIRNLHQMGKQVVLMGDINISRDLIDSAAYISELLKAKVISSTNSEESNFETVNQQICEDFQSSTIPRKLLNSLLTDSITPALALNGIMYDTTRRHQGRKHKLYTVWNTMTNARPSNFGSRIDLILATKGCNSQASNIWPQIMGSDHCPVYTDFEEFFVGNGDRGSVSSEKTKLGFEAVKFYKLGRQGGLDMLFQSMRKRKLDEEVDREVIEDTQQVNQKASASGSSSVVSLSSKRSVKTKTRPTQATLAHFFKKPTPAAAAADQTSQFIDLSSEDQQSQSLSLSHLTSPSISLKLTNGKFSIPSDPKPPLCKHNIESILKTSRSENNKGRKFWSCGKPMRNGGDGLVLKTSNNDNKLGHELDEFSCGFFKWK
ncbi:hypothetical protein WICPIJ_006157 [Wickerhamomyces pijperi]|uniref:DNA-(apurinic or apyrimidinic site) endonuclease 2 n=1 Tax=Wickerhamomyces pijperi TaxID=599730 RepID=A0A9P8Q485_WICPI|nr:hypothetical protein WICPIJ_006157 [Wickerhamomyces pijperi]